MTQQEELIARQAVKIHALETKLHQMTNSMQNIYNICYCIGGPLNDNKKGYTSDQMDDFHRIAEQTGIVR